MYDGTEGRMYTDVFHARLGQVVQIGRSWFYKHNGLYYGRVYIEDLSDFLEITGHSRKGRKAGRPRAATPAAAERECIETLAHSSVLYVPQMSSLVGRIIVPKVGMSVAGLPRVAAQKEKFSRLDSVFVFAFGNLYRASGGDPFQIAVWKAFECGLEQYLFRAWLNGVLVLGVGESWASNVPTGRCQVKHANDPVVKAAVRTAVQFLDSELNLRFRLEDLLDRSARHDEIDPAYFPDDLRKRYNATLHDPSVRTIRALMELHELHPGEQLIHVTKKRHGRPITATVSPHGALWYEGGFHTVGEAANHVANGNQGNWNGYLYWRKPNGPTLDLLRRSHGLKWAGQ